MAAVGDARKASQPREVFSGGKTSDPGSDAGFLWMRKLGSKVRVLLGRMSPLELDTFYRCQEGLSLFLSLVKLSFGKKQLVFFSIARCKTSAPGSDAGFLWMRKLGSKVRVLLGRMTRRVVQFSKKTRTFCRRWFRAFKRAISWAVGSSALVCGKTSRSWEASTEVAGVRENGFSPPVSR